MSSAIENGQPIALNDPQSLQIGAESVCVIIAAYNATETISCAIRSALAEPEVSQVIVVDDASTDNTRETALGADDGSRRLTLFSQAVNAGPSAARNLALSHARADWIAILDADDFFLPGRIKGLLKFAAGIDMIADDLWQVPETDIGGPRRRLLGVSLDKPKKVGFTEFVLSNVTQGRRQRVELGFIKPIIRRSFLEKSGLRYREDLRLGEDFELYARALALGAKLLLVPAQGYVSVVRADSLSGRHSEADLLHLRDCGDRLRQTLALGPHECEALRRHYLSVDCRLQWRLLILAVKARDLRAALAAFARPYPVPAYLLKQLAGQIYLRMIRRWSRCVR